MASPAGLELRDISRALHFLFACASYLGRLSFTTAFPALMMEVTADELLSMALPVFAPTNLVVPAMYPMPALAIPASPVRTSITVFKMSSAELGGGFVTVSRIVLGSNPAAALPKPVFALSKVCESHEK